MGLFIVWLRSFTLVPSTSLARSSVVVLLRTMAALSCYGSLAEPGLRSSQMLLSAGLADASLSGALASIGCALALWFSRVTWLRSTFVVLSVHLAALSLFGSLAKPGLRALLMILSKFLARSEGLALSGSLARSFEVVLSKTVATPESLSCVHGLDALWGTGVEVASRSARRTPSRASARGTASRCTSSLSRECARVAACPGCSA